LTSADDAIKQRPNDFHYHVVRGVILIAEGSPGQADSELSTSNEMASEQNPKLSDDSSKGIVMRDQMNTIEQALGSKTLSTDGKAALQNRYCSTR